MRAAVRVGDPTSHGGAVGSAGQSLLRVAGVLVAVTGAMNNEPPPAGISGYPHGPSLLTGSAILRVAGLPVVLSGDAAPCGATATATSTLLRST